ncbi:hypothetical protein [Kibdelosporangium phytohabitans]|uniref:Uncharacterized protein n=1 Tax=Kibdelosporangium phytohabitans TaxID=860235 RepID=A0A0N9HV69_9PSEU|nr:hypothetical protein [Kibdelosporangium phytohabitans]ALG07424.1 hypothetical protein AOZ06_11275 [Kibdelosporangium phytohabitans]MBE1471686.1 hypothetical protein [Kibdelosporangium phytohabitans]
MSELIFADSHERDDLGAFVARAVRLDGDSVVRLKARTSANTGEDLIDAWVATPFDVLATRTVRGSMQPADVTVSANELLAGLAIVRGETVDPGLPRDLLWRSALPPGQGWQIIDQLPAEVVSSLADKGLTVARENPGPHGTPPASLLDQTVLTVSSDGMEIKVPLRCLFAMSGMGFLGNEGPDEQVRVTATDSWLRIDARFGAVVRRRHALLPLLV